MPLPKDPFTNVPNGGFPERIIIVRHGERIDHVDNTWGTKSDRPHDSPLTPDGHEMASRLGAYLRDIRYVDPDNVVFLSSPLRRCVETSHGISDGLGVSAPIVIEEGLVEGSYWMWRDMCKNPSVRGGAVPQPVTHDAAYHQQHHSPLVLTDRDHVPQFHPPVIYNTKGKHKLEEKIDVKERCERAAQTLGGTPSKALAGKTVICVGHGQTTILWYNALVSRDKRIHGISPYYTGFAELTVIPKEAADGTLVRPNCVPALAPFGSPHLDD